MVFGTTTGEATAWLKILYEQNEVKFSFCFALNLGKAITHSKLSNSHLLLKIYNIPSNRETG